jgi:hypothetical protein
MPLQIRRGTTAERLSITPLPGELILDTDLNTVFIGNGSTIGGVSALTGITSEDAMDIVGQMFLNGQHQGLSFSYGSTQDTANRIDARLDFSSYDGEFVASAFRGSLYANDSTLLVNADTGQINPAAIQGIFGGPIATSQLTADNIFGYLIGGVTGSVFSDTSTLLVNGIDGSINLDGTVKGDIIPAGNELYDLGSSSNRFKDLYLSGTSLYLGDAILTSIGTSVNLPAGSTIDGTPIGTGSGTGDGVVAGSNYNINIVSDDSAILVNSATGVIAASSFIGDITSNLIITDDIQTDTISARVGAVIYHNNQLEQKDQILIINDLDNNNSSFSIRKNTNSGNFGARLTFFRSRGVDTAPVSVSSGDVLSVLSSGGYDGSGFTSGAAITVLADSTVSPGIVPGSIVFSTMNASGNFADRGRFTSAGNFELFQPMLMSRTSVLSDFMFLQQFHSSPNDSSNVTFTRARGTPTAPTSASSNDAIIDLAAAAFDGVTYTGSSTIRMNIDGAVSSGIVPGRIEFWTADSLGNQTKKAQFNKDGILEVDTIRSLTSSLTIIGDLTGSVFSDGSTMIIDGTDGTVKYYPTTPGDWAGTPPTTVGEAIDRLAARLKLIDGGVGA